MTELKDLCCVEACVLLAPNKGQGAELLRLGLLELTLLSHLTITCTPSSTTLTIQPEQLTAIKQHEVYKALHIFLEECFQDKTSAPLAEIITTAQKYFGLSLEGFNTYAIKPCLQSKNLIIEKHYKRFFIFKATKLMLSKKGESLKQELKHQLEDQKMLSNVHALLRPEENQMFTKEMLNTITCFNNSFVKHLNSSSDNPVKETGLF